MTDTVSTTSDTEKTSAMLSPSAFVRDDAQIDVQRDEDGDVNVDITFPDQAYMSLRLYLSPSAARTLGRNLSAALSAVTA